MPMLLRGRAALRRNTFTAVCPLQFVGEPAMKALPLRFCCPARCVGDQIRAFSRHRTLATMLVYRDERDRMATHRRLTKVVAETLGSGSVRLI